MLGDRSSSSINKPSLSDKNIQRNNIFSDADGANPNQDHKLEQALAQSPALLATANEPKALFGWRRCNVSGA
jgi:hypothetical protein